MGQKLTDSKQTKLYCIPTLKELENYLAFSEEYGASFEYNDFFIPTILDNEKQKTELINIYLSTGRDVSNDTLHGAFLDICVNSADPKIFSASDLRVRQSMEIAAKMGLKAVIFHTNYIVNFRLENYYQSWLDGNEIYWRRVLADFPTLEIYIENMFDDEPMLLKCLAERMSDEPRFGVCLDIAHAAISGTPLKPWMSAMQKYVRHLHLNDNDGIQDLHHAVGTGTIAWNAFEEWCRCLESKPTALIEVRSFAELKTSVTYMKENHIFPFD